MVKREKRKKLLAEAGHERDRDENLEAVLADLAATGKVRLPTRKGGVKPFEGVEIKGESIIKTLIKDRK